jgi:hypothetical protein
MQPKVFKIERHLSHNLYFQVGELLWNKKCLVMVSNPLQSYLALGGDDGIVDFINVFAADDPKILTAINLCNERISGIQIDQHGNYVVACAMERGMFFSIEVLNFNCWPCVMNEKEFNYLAF